jgi:hypothetical protein
MSHFILYCSQMLPKMCFRTGPESGDKESIEQKKALEA